MELSGRNRAKAVVEARGLFVYLSRKYTQASNREIGKFLRRNPIIVSYFIKQSTLGPYQRVIEKRNLF